MAADNFFARWSKRKAEATPKPMSAASDPAAAPVVASAADSAPQALAPLQPKPLPTLADVEGLTAESDYAAFVAKGVDEAVKRSAMKKLFALPQFNIMDGLDIYVGDYSQPDPLPPGMLEALNHAKNALNPAQFFTRPMSPLLEQAIEQAPVMEEAAEGIPAIPDAAPEATDIPAPALLQENTGPVIESEQQPGIRPVLEPQAVVLSADAATHKNEAV